MQLEFKRQEEYTKEHHLNKSGYHNSSNKFPFLGSKGTPTVNQRYLARIKNSLYLVIMI